MFLWVFAPLFWVENALVYSLKGLSQKLFKKQLAQPFSIQNRNISPKKTSGEKKEYKKKRIIKILVLEYEMNCEDSS